MAGSKMGAVKRKLGLRGKTKPGEMLSRMNAMKSGAMKCKDCGMSYKSSSMHKHKFNLGSAIKSGERMIGQGLRTAGAMGKAFVRNATGGDSDMILNHSTYKKTKAKKKINTGLIRDTIKGIPQAASRLSRDASQMLTGVAVGGAVPMLARSQGRVIGAGAKDFGRALMGKSDNNKYDYVGNKKKGKGMKKKAK